MHSLTVNKLKRVARKLARPRLSLVVIVYKMPEQAKNTLYSLSLDYQEGVFEEDYEVVVIENASDEPMGASALKGLRGNFRYYYREENLPTPVPAINFGARLSRGKNIGIMIDGARMATPGIVRHMLFASRMSRNAVVAVPGYHLGYAVQQEAIHSGYTYETEKELLKSINWPKNGYKLFDIGCASATSRAGFFRPMGESNCISVPRHIWKKLEGFDDHFTETGGGQANLDFYKRVCERSDVDLILLAGEGTFHQFHGGVTTGTAGEERKKIMQAHFDQYKSIRGEHYSAPQRRPMLFGSFTNPSLKFMNSSLDAAQSKYKLKW